MSNNDDLYVFADENREESSNKNYWKILIVDDEWDLHEITKMALEGLEFDNKKLFFISAYSSKEAHQIMEHETDIALILLDIVMEDNHAGLQFVEYVRKHLANYYTRIIIRTGQSPDPEMQRRIITDYDINDYQNKSELSAEKLYNSVLLALHSYRDLLRIEESRRQLEALLEAGQRLVPSAFLKLLKKARINDVKLGDCVENEMTTFFLDIRSFSTIIERLTPQESFEFINSCLSYVEPAIVSNNGFIDKYFGDGIIALFGSADDAVKAAVNIFPALDNLNHDLAMLGKIPVRVGIGINTGKVMVGAIGFHDRMDFTVIGDSVNIAARLQEMTKEFSISILISESVVKAMTEKNYRYLGEAQVRGKRQPVKIYEVFTVDAEQVRELKNQTRDDFEKAIKDYFSGDYQSAQQNLLKILEINPGDFVTKYFLNKIEEK